MRGLLGLLAPLVALFGAVIGPAHLVRLPLVGAVADARVVGTYRIAILSLVPPDCPQIQGLRDGLKDAGYVKGKNLVLDLLVKRTYDDIHAAARASAQQKVDVIVAVGTIETEPAQSATKYIPIVFMPATDPVRAGFVKSLARPETNITGLMYLTDLKAYGKQLEVFKATVPALRRAWCSTSGKTRRMSPGCRF